MCARALASASSASWLPPPYILDNFEGSYGSHSDRFLTGEKINPTRTCPVAVVNVEDELLLK